MRSLLGLIVVLFVISLLGPFGVAANSNIRGGQVIDPICDVGKSQDLMQPCTGDVGATAEEIETCEAFVDWEYWDSVYWPRWNDHRLRFFTITCETYTALNCIPTAEGNRLDSVDDDCTSVQGPFDLWNH